MRGLPIVNNIGVSGRSSSGGSISSSNKNVTGSSGTIDTLIRKLGVGSSFSVLSGSDPTLSLSGLNVVSSTSFTIGQSRIIYIREYTSNRLAVEYSITYTLQPQRPAPPIIAIYAFDFTSITISWNDGSDNGSTITGRYIYISTTSGSSGTLTPIVLSSGRTIISGLTPGQTYYIKGYTQNALGYSDPSSEISRQTINNANTLTFSLPVNSQYIPLLVF